MSKQALSKYIIIFSKKADKYIDSLDSKAANKIIEKIKLLKTSNESLDIKKLKTISNLYRLRVGNFRVIYTIQHEKIVIYIVTIGHRKNIYKQSNLA